MSNCQKIFFTNRLAPAPAALLACALLAAISLAGCELFNPMPENDLEKKIDDRVKYAKAPWVPLTIETNGLGITSPAPGTHGNLVKLGYSFKLSFVPDSGYPFRGWQAWVEGAGMRSVWKNDSDSQNGGDRPERVRFAPLNAAGTEVEIFVYEMPPEGKRLVIGPFGFTNDELDVRTNSGDLGSIYPAFLSGVKLDFPFTISFQPSSAYPFRGWQAKFISGDGVLAESVWTPNDDGTIAEQKIEGMLWSPRNASGLEMEVTIEELPPDFALERDSIIIGPLGMDSGYPPVHILPSTTWGVTNPPRGMYNDKRSGFPFAVEFAVTSGWHFEEWRAYLYIDGWSWENPGSPLGTDDVNIGNSKESRTVVTVNTSDAVILMPYCIKRTEVTAFNLPGHFDDRKVTNYPIRIYFSNKIDGNCLNWDNFILIADTNYGIGGPLQDITKYYKLPEVNEKLVSIFREEVDEDAAAKFINLNITIRLNLGGIYDEADKILMGEPGQYREFYYGVSSSSYSQAPLTVNLEAATGSGNVLFPGDPSFQTGTPPVTEKQYYVTEVPEKNNQHVVYLLFEKEVLENSINKLYVDSLGPVRITERREGEMQDRITNAIQLAATDSPYSQLVDKYKEKHPGKEPYIVYHVLQTIKDGVIQLAVQPTDNLNNHDTFTAAQKVRVIIDTISPGTVSSVKINYNPNEKTLALSWTNPNDNDFDKVLLSHNVTGQTTEEELGSTDNQYSFPNISANSTGYTFSLTTVDVIGNKSEQVMAKPPVSVVTFNSNSGTSVPAQSILSGGRVANPVDPTRTRYTFNGWYTDNNFTGNAWNFTNDTLNGNITLYAKWTFTVSYDLNGGIGTLPNQQTVIAGESVTLAAGAGITREKYDFAGWNTNAAGTGTDYNAGSAHTLTGGNTTLYAKWLAKITFESNGGSGVSDQYILPDGKVTRPTNPTRTGYTFNGWYRDNDFAQPWDFTNDAVTGHTTLYAKWVYTVTFNANSGTPAPAMQYILPNDKVSEPAAMTRTGYTFDGWYTNNSFSTQWNFTTNTVTANTTLYARWYSTVTYNINGGTGTTPGQQTPNAGNSITLPTDSLNGFYRCGFTLAGWNTKADGTGDNYTTSYMPTGTTTLYAKWTPGGLVQGGGLTTLAQKLAWLQTNAQSNSVYTLEATANENLAPHTLSYSGKTGVTVTLVGTGTTRTVTLSSNGSMFTVNSGVTLVLDNRITLQGRSNNTASLVRVNSGGTLVMNAGSAIKNNANTSTSIGSDGGGVYINGGTFTMINGEISGNSTLRSSGGVHIQNGNFTMTSGTISGNSAVDNGGGVFINGSTFTMNGGTISGNNAGNTGGGVNVWNGTFNMNNGTISTNTAPYGGGVYVTGTFTMTNGTISGNTASIYGGGVHVNITGTFTKTGGTIYGYSANDTANSNVVKNSSGTVQSNRGHAVYASRDSISKSKETTAGTGVNLSFNATAFPPSWSGNWDDGGLVFVPGGSFQMGQNLGTGGGSDIIPVHTVTVSNFYIGKYEVTQAKYQEVMGNIPSNTYGVGNNFPVYAVSWYSALVFCNKLSDMEGLTPVYRINNSTNTAAWGSVPTSNNATWNAVTTVSGATGYRLPTEAEWEYAAKGGDPNAAGWVGYTYAGSNTVGDVAWHSGNNGGTGSKQVGTKTANRLGLYDMSGNVREWCWDWRGNYPNTAQTNPSGASSGTVRVARGGSWMSNAEEHRSVHRGPDSSNTAFTVFGTIPDIGFRVVRKE